MSNLEQAYEGNAGMRAPARTLRAEWLVLASVTFAAAGQLLLKSGLIPAGSGGPASLPVIGVGLLVYGLGTLLWIAAVSRAEISYLYPLSAINYSVVALGGSMLFHEPVHWDRWAGIATMSLGIALLTRTAAAEAP